jgi:hypothetical protein
LPFVAAIPSVLSAKGIQQENGAMLLADYDCIKGFMQQK